MKWKVLMVAMVLVAGVAGATPRSATRNAGSAQVVLHGDRQFEALTERYPGLDGAYLATLSRGVLRQAAFRQADVGRMRLLAESLLAEARVVPGSDWVEDADRARLLATPETDELFVLQHHVDGIDVEGSFVVVRRRLDGSGEVSSSLLSVEKPRGALLTPRLALQKAVGTSSPAESMSGEVFSEPRYVRSATGVARLAYGAVTVDAAGKPWLLQVDAETGRELARSPSLMPFDSAPDDNNWTMPPWVWVGKDDAGNQRICSPSNEDLTATDYYPIGNALPGIRVQVNVSGPAVRMRNPALGLTTINWAGKSHQELLSTWPTWTWADLASQIPQKEHFQQCIGGTFPEPSGFAGYVPYTQSEVDQYHYLQVAIQDIEARFGWKGLNNDYNPLVLVQNVSAEAGCALDVGNGSSHFGVIWCAHDGDAAAAGAPQRIAPVEVFAHEFAHSVLLDLGLGYSDFESGALSEALADIFAVSVKARHGGDPWLIADREPFLQRRHEWMCLVAGGEYCAQPPLVALRDLANPKTNDSIDPAAEHYLGDYWNAPLKANGQPSLHGSGQVVSKMLHRIAEGTPPGARDGNPAKGLYDGFAGIGLQEMLDIFRVSLHSLPQVYDADWRLDEYAKQFRVAAIQQCGQWSEADLVAGKAAWIANLAEDIDIEAAGYVMPTFDQQDVFQLSEFKFEGESSQLYDFQVATDMDFVNIVREDTIKSNSVGGGRFLVKLSPHTDHWWRVRLTNAPMISSPWVVSKEACWRPAAPFRSGGPARVTNAKPAGQTAATGDEVEPWNVVFSWTGDERFRGYEFWVDYEEPEGAPRYANVLAHKLYEADGSWPADVENPGTLALPNFKVLPIPLPKSSHLCWKIVPFTWGDDGKRIDGEPNEQCFRTSEPQTLISHPAPPSVDGTLSSVPAQPLAIDYDPADGAVSHEFSLEVLDLDGINAPAAQGQWAYIDNVDSDKANTVTEVPNPPDWTDRTRLRMLPVQLDASPYINYGLSKVRITIESRSPMISAPEHGGTYVPRRETAEPAVRDFRPADPANFAALRPFVTSPPAMGYCSSEDNTDLFIEWNHGPDATPEVVEKYHVKLYPKRCGNGALSGCQVIGDPSSPAFAASLAHDRSVEHNTKTSQRVDFLRSELFPNPADELNGVTGFLAHLYGVTGPSPGPAGLNITGTFLADLPVLPAKLEPQIKFRESANNSNNSFFSVWAGTNKNPKHDLRGDIYLAPAHEITLKGYAGDQCDEELLMTTNDKPFDLTLKQAGMANDQHPVMSVRAVMKWEGMGCRTLVSKCVVGEGVNRQFKPAAITGLAPFEAAGKLGVSWNTTDDPYPDTLEYFIAVDSQGNGNALVHHPSDRTFTAAELAIIDGKFGHPALTSIDPADQGKALMLRVKVCRAGTDKCSTEVKAAYTVGASAGGVPPDSPQDVALHLQQSGGLGALVGQDLGFEAGWISVSWNTPASGTPASYYLVTFSATGAVPGVLPNWLNTLGVPGVDYPADPLQYTGVIRALPGGLLLGDEDWGDYVWFLAETHQSAPPSAGTWLSAKVWACAGNPPLSPLRDHEWIIGASTGNCSAAVQTSMQYP